MATIVDVAKLAGVSTSTVSHVLNATRPVREDTRARVEEAIRATGYRRDSVARAMRRSRTDSIGLVVSDVTQPAFAEMVRGVEHEAAAAGHTLLLANSGEDPSRELRALRVLTERRVDGLIIAPVGGSHRKEMTEIQQRGTPLVLMDRLGGIRADQVGVENVLPMRDVVLHLIEHGHRRIALAAGDAAVSTISERRQGYLDALAEASIETDDSLVLMGSGLAADVRRRMTELLQEPDRPTAVVAASTEAAIGVLEAAGALDLKTPRDFAFATFDGFPHADLFHPRISTITQPAYEIGSTAMQLLLSRLEDDPKTSYRSVRLAPEITYRESCGCPD
ncbi:LacI family DNA-binding transcriptional regulator [Streptomyces himalayensis]|uniref:LacI family DNA-binding transcriptional regulator n=1 Tax=Streptomyces himalayensis subsp. himalayensis TaxID=2756131 RepID=A0A7W0ICE1_9ACTN|nr:LacI family DNA-binding transcriptional regulator [Streptomyces himalayensis]MBA2950433.1 LacI family DNA-binding transcriptional regulator [Streptomyces himalayensis subsp. himalayensis]